MWVRISGTKERGHSREVAGMVQVRIRRSDQSAGECDEATIARGVGGDELGRKARALGEAADHDVLTGYACIHGELYRLPHLRQSRTKPGLVLLYWHHKGVGIPTMVRGLGSKVCNALVVHLRREPEDVLRRRAAAVQKNHCSSRLVERCAQSADGLITMGITHQISLHGYL